MKKILLIQENGRHDLNRNYRECFSLQRAFIHNGNHADVWGLDHLNYDKTPEWESYDLIINLENYDETNWVPDLSNIKNPIKCLWSVDAHCRGEQVYENTFSKGNYQYLLHSTKDFVSKPYHVWFPNAFDDELIKPLNIEKTVQFGFCGNYVNRKPLLEWLRDNHGLKLDIFIIGDKMVEVINTYKCHFNKNMANDVNYRSFETIGCGTILLTNYNPQYIELGFKDNVNCFFYDTLDDLVQKINYIKNTDLNHMKNDILNLSKHHTYKNRVNYLLEKIYG